MNKNVEDWAAVIVFLILLIPFAIVILLILAGLNPNG